MPMERMINFFKKINESNLFSKVDSDSSSGYIFDGSYDEGQVPSTRVC